MRVMDNLLTYAYAVDHELMVLAILKMARWSVKYGLCKHSPPVFAAYGMLMIGVLGDSKKGTEYGNIALSMVDQRGFQDVEARTIFIAHNLVLHWIHPLAANLKEYRRAYKIGLRTGDIENAMLNIIYHCDEATNIGRPLSKVVSDLKSYLQQAKDLQLEYFYKLTLPLLQFAMNQMGDSEDPVVLTGEAMDQEEMLTTKQMFLVYSTRFSIMWLAVYFHQYELAWDTVDSSRDMAEIMIGRHVIWRSALFEGLAAFSLARTTKKRVWRQRAQRVLLRIKKWEKHGNVNCLHILRILEAEQAALGDRVDEAKKAYRVAIQTAGKLGFPNDSALFNERASAYIRSVGDDDSMYWAKHYLKDAYKLYADWEAWGKTKQLEKLYPDLFDNMIYGE